MFDLGVTNPRERQPRLTPEERRERDVQRQLARGVHPASLRKIVSKGICMMCRWYRPGVGGASCTLPGRVNPRGSGVFTKANWPSCEMFDKEST